MTEWVRTKRKDKIIILGSRAGTSLVHKCLLQSGLINWGVWSLHTHDSEPGEVRMNLWFKYPKIKMNKIIPKYFWEICKCPELAFIMKDFVKHYPGAKIIKMDRDLNERVQSHLKAWGNGFYRNLVLKSKALQQMFLDEFGYIPEDDECVFLYNCYKQKVEEDFLKGYPKELVLRIDFHKLMDDFDNEMQKIAEFVNIPFEVYIPLWKEMRKIQHMATGSNINKWIKP